MTNPLKDALLYIYMCVCVCVCVCIINWRFSQYCGWGFTFSGTWYCVVGWAVSIVWKDHIAFIFKHQTVQELIPQHFFVLTIFPHNTPFRRKYVGQTGMLTFVWYNMDTGQASLWHRWVWGIWQGKAAVLKETFVPLFHYKSQIEYPGTETGSQQWAVGIYWPELTRSTSCVTLTIVKQNSLQDMVSHTFQSYSVSKTYFGFH